MLYRPLGGAVFDVAAFAVKFRASGEGLPVGMFVDYEIVPAHPLSCLQGEVLPLKWRISGMTNNGEPYATSGYLQYQQEQANWYPIAIPTMLAYIYDMFGRLVGTYSPDTETAGGVKILTACVLPEAWAPGEYLIEFHATMAYDGQIRIVRSTINVQPAVETFGVTMGIAVYPEYNVVFQVPSEYISGEEMVLKWAITDTSGADVQLPISGAIVVTDRFGNTQTLTPYTESSTAASAQIMAAIWVPPGTGDYTAQLMATFSDGQIRGSKVSLSVSE